MGRHIYIALSLIVILLFYPTDHNAQDSDGTIYFSKPQEETIEKDEPPLSVNKGSLKVDSKSIVDDHPKNETIKSDKLDEDLKTAVCRIDVSG